MALTSGKRVILGAGPFKEAIRHHPDVAFELIKVLVERIYHMQRAADGKR